MVGKVGGGQPIYPTTPEGQADVKKMTNATVEKHGRKITPQTEGRNFIVKLFMNIKGAIDRFVVGKKLEKKCNQIILALDSGLKKEDTKTILHSVKEMRKICDMLKSKGKDTAKLEESLNAVEDYATQVSLKAGNKPLKSHEGVQKTLVESRDDFIKLNKEIGAKKEDVSPTRGEFVNEQMEQAIERGKAREAGGEKLMRENAKHTKEGDKVPNKFQRGTANFVYGDVGRALEKGRTERVEEKRTEHFKGIADSKMAAKASYKKTVAPQQQARLEPQDIWNKKVESLNKALENLAQVAGDSKEFSKISSSDKEDVLNEVASYMEELENGLVSSGAAHRSPKETYVIFDDATMSDVQEAYETLRKEFNEAVDIVNS